MRPNESSVNEEIKKKLRQETLYPQIIVENGFIGEKDKKDEKEFFKKIAKAIMIDAVKTNIDTGEVNYDLSFDYGGKKTATLSRGDLTKTKLLKLTAQGADVFDHNVKHIIMHLSNQEFIAPKINVHQQLGWGYYKGEPIFKHYKAINIDSQYVGSMTIEPKGTFKKWKSMVEGEVIGQIPLEAALVFGLSSVVVGFINEEVVFGSLIAHFSGDSTEGKTTACQLAISTAGYPDTKKNGLMTTWNSTLNATMGILRDNNGLPVLLDESSMSGTDDFTQIIYTLAGGKEKARMNKELGLRDSATWNTTILSNGEYALTTKSKQNAGIKVRLSEFQSVRWTKSAKNAEAIKETILENYGHAAPMLAEYLLKLGKETILERYEKWRAKCLEALGDSDRFAPRIAIKLGLLMTAAEVAKECLDLAFDLEGILQFLVSNEKQSVDIRDIYTTAFDYILEQVSIHQDKFSSTHGKLSEGVEAIEGVRHEHWGKIDCKGELREINITRSAFDKLLAGGKFEDSKIILKEWKRRGLLNCEKDRYSRKRKLTATGVAIEVYVLKVPKELLDDEEDYLDRSKIKKRVVKK